MVEIDASSDSPSKCALDRGGRQRSCCNCYWDGDQDGGNHGREKFAEVPAHSVVRERTCACKTVTFCDCRHVVSVTCVKPAQSPASMCAVPGEAYDVVRYFVSRAHASKRAREGVRTSEQANERTRGRVDSTPCCRQTLYLVSTRRDK